MGDRRAARRGANLSAGGSTTVVIHLRVATWRLHVPLRSPSATSRAAAHFRSSAVIEEPPGLESAMARCAASPESSAIVSRSWRMMPTTDRSGRGGTPVTLSTRPILWPDESSHSNDRARPGMSSPRAPPPTRR